MQGVAGQATDFTFSAVSLTVVLMVDKHSCKWPISMGEQEKGGDWFPFWAGVTDAYSAIPRFFNHAMRYKGYGIVRNTEAQELAYLLA